MKLVEHDKSGVLAAPERAELVMFVPGHRQEGVATIHKVALQKRFSCDLGNKSIGHRMIHILKNLVQSWEGIHDK